MSLPGTTVTLRDTAQARSAPTDTGIWFVAGFTEQGPASPVAITSMAEYLSTFGARVSYGYVYDSLEVFFREGGGRAYVSRVLGPTPVAASKMLKDSANADTLLVEAKTLGDWGNLLNVAVLTGDQSGEFKIQVSHDTDGILETSPSVATKAEAVTWAGNSRYVRLTDQASVLDPVVVAAASLASGTDDHLNATETEWVAALTRFSRDLGPGQVSMPGRTTATAHTNLLAHAASHNRFALLDLADTATAATLLTAADAARSVNARWGAAFSPWAVVAGLVAGTTRTVPYSAVEAGMIARNDASGTPNAPTAGRHGISSTALDLSQPPFSDADREALNDAGVNVVITKFGQVRTYGYRTLADPDTETNYLLASNMRLIMAITAEADVIAENYLFAVIDGAGHLFADFQGDLVGMLMPYYDNDSLFGATPEEAFYVDVGAQVNTPETIAAFELHAVLDLRLSPFGERVVIEIVKKPTTERVI